METISSFIGKKFDSKPVYGDSDKSRINSYEDKIDINFQG